MNRRWFLVLGLLIVVSNVAVLAVFGFSAASGTTIAATVATALGGMLFALGGLDRQFQRVEWYQFVGGANIIMGVAMSISFLVPIVNGTSPDESGVEIMFAICAAVGGASLLYIGVDWIRGGHHFDLSSYELRPIVTMDR